MSMQEPTAIKLNKEEQDIAKKELALRINKLDMMIEELKLEKEWAQYDLKQLESNDTLTSKACVGCRGIENVG